MVSAASLCAACHHPLRTGLARVTDRGYVCASDPLCEAIAHALTTTKENPVQPNQHRPLAPDEGDRMMALYRQGATLIEVAALTGRSTSTIKRILNERGVELRAKGRRRGADLYSVPETSEELAYTGGWRRVGMIWKPTMQEAS